MKPISWMTDSNNIGYLFPLIRNKFSSNVRYKVHNEITSDISYDTKDIVKDEAKKVLTLSRDMLYSS